MQSCHICNTPQTIYSCPRCHLKFCSLKCQKSHECLESDLPLIPSLENAKIRPKALHEPIVSTAYNDESYLSAAEKHLICNDEGLAEMLKNQKILKFIDYCHEKMNNSSVSLKISDPSFQLLSAMDKNRVIQEKTREIVLREIIDSTIYQDSEIRLFVEYFMQLLNIE